MNKHFEDLRNRKKKKARGKETSTQPSGPSGRVQYDDDMVEDPLDDYGQVFEETKMSRR
jgi:hypothetical protein